MALKQGASKDEFNPFTQGMGIQYNQLMFNMNGVSITIDYRIILDDNIGLITGVFRHVL